MATAEKLAAKKREKDGQRAEFDAAIKRKDFAAVGQLLGRDVKILLGVRSSSWVSKLNRVVFSAYASVRRGELCLGDQNIGDVGASSLAKLIQTNAPLTTVLLHDDTIGRTGVASIVAALKTNATLTKLELKGSRIDDSCIASFAEVIKTNTTLTTLSIVGGKSKIGLACAVSLAEALETNTTLTTLHPGGDIDYAGASKQRRQLEEAISAAIERNRGASSSASSSEAPKDKAKAKRKAGATEIKGAPGKKAKRS